jgi:hypothetical protein
VKAKIDLRADDDASREESVMDGWMAARANPYLRFLSNCSIRRGSLEKGVIKQSGTRAMSSSVFSVDNLTCSTCLLKHRSKA